MKKYLYGFKVYFLSSFHYRFNTFVNLIFSNLNLLIVIAFWFLVYKGDTDKVLRGFTLPDMVTYFIISNLFFAFIMRDSGFNFSSMIKNGNLGSVLLKPYNISISVYFQNLACNITNLIPQILMISLVVPFISKFLVYEFTNIGLISIFFMTIIGSISSHLIWSILGYMAFWFETAESLMWTFAVLLDMLTGMIIPLDFFPNWSIQILEVLPFSSWGYIQTKIYLGFYSVEKQILLICIHLVWLVILYAFNKLVWNRGIKKFSSVGG